MCKNVVTVLVLVVILSSCASVVARAESAYVPKPSVLEFTAKQSYAVREQT